MPLKTKCTKCGARYEYSAEEAGTRVQCDCGAVVDLPVPASKPNRRALFAAMGLTVVVAASATVSWAILSRNGKASKSASSSAAPTSRETGVSPLPEIIPDIKPSVMAATRVQNPFKTFVDAYNDYPFLPEVPAVASPILAKQEFSRRYVAWKQDVSSWSQRAIGATFDEKSCSFLDAERHEAERGGQARIEVTFTKSLAKSPRGASVTWFISVQIPGTEDNANFWSNVSAIDRKTFRVTGLVSSLKCSPSIGGSSNSELEKELKNGTFTGAMSEEAVEDNVFIELRAALVAP